MVVSTANTSPRPGRAVLGLGMSSSTAPDAVAQAAAWAERCGYRSFWLNHESEASVDLAALAAAARVTERIELGIGVVPISVGMDALLAEVDSLGIAQARLTIGLGTGDSASLPDLRRAVVRLRESRAERVVVGALGALALRMAGEEANGVLLNWLGPSHALHSREITTRAAIAAGRAVPRISAYVRIAIGEDAEQRSHRCAAAYAGYPAYRRHFKRQEVDAATLVVRARDGAGVAAELRAWDGVVDEIIVRPLDIADLDAVDPIMGHFTQTAAVGSAGAPTGA